MSLGRRSFLSAAGTCRSDFGYVSIYAVLKKFEYLCLDFKPCVKYKLVATAAAIATLIKLFLQISEEAVPCFRDAFQKLCRILF